MTRFVLAACALLLVAPGTVSAQDIQNLFVGDGPVHFSLRTGDVVPDSAVTESNWDFVIDGVDLNPNVSGALLDQSFDSVSEIPAGVLVADDFRSTSGNRWYNYDQNSHFVWPEPDQTFVLELPDGRFAKFEIYSYYNVETEEPRYVSFRYAVSENGTRSFGG